MSLRVLICVIVSIEIIEYFFKEKFLYFLVYLHTCANMNLTLSLFL